MSLPPTRILIVDDSALYRQSLKNVLREVTDVTVVGTAKDGVDALQKIEQLDPDLLTLDVQMPDMDGIQLLQKLKRHRSAPTVIMVSSLTAEGAQVTTQALMEGAFDFILKPASGDPVHNRQQLLEALAEKIAAFRESSRSGRKTNSSKAETTPSGSASSRASETESAVAVPVPSAPCRLVILGASTGGPEALKHVLPRLPDVLPVPVVVVQHMPPNYTTSLARRLDAICSLEVVEASDRQALTPGTVFLAPGGRQLKFSRLGGKTYTCIRDDAAENGVRPSVDYLIRSAIEVYAGDILVVIMTGMGRDGLEGCRGVKRAGGYVFAQSQADCVVYGMPKAVIEADLADRILSLGKLAPAVYRHVKRSQRETRGDRL